MFKGRYTIHHRVAHTSLWGGELASTLFCGVTCQCELSARTQPQCVYRSECVVRLI